MNPKYQKLIQDLFYDDELNEIVDHFKELMGEKKKQWVKSR